MRRIFSFFPREVRSFSSKGEFAAEVLLTRILRSDSKKNGPARLVLPGFFSKTPPFSSGVGLLGKISSNRLIEPFNTYSCSEDYGNDRRFSYTEPLPGYVMAYVLSEYRIEAIETEIDLEESEIFGTFATSVEELVESELFREFSAEGKKGYVFKENDLYEIDERFELVPAVFSPEVISFNQARSEEEIKIQNEVLQEKFKTYVEERAAALKEFTPLPLGVHIDEVSAIVRTVVLSQALKINPAYRESREEYSRLLEEKRLEEEKKLKTDSPSTEVKDPRSEKRVMDDRWIEAGGD